MGIGNIGWTQLLVVLVIVLLIFGTKRIRNIGSDLGGAIREFRKGVGDNDEDDSAASKDETEADSRDKGEPTSRREQ
ncbi:twin-arginine translocase TatA/TatE family subunit [Wenzhouxiangella sp. EGI_FJ10409]|uniref:twin-arginine translocase TatA/TatE family subunit n=1 Tax=Wenzhouxiangella sp. EGI_FJ10409 TaxID=3243767 RepID=UPI0035DB2EB6